MSTGAFEVEDAHTGDQNVTLLLLLVVVKLEYRTAQEDRLYVQEGVPPFLNYLTMDFSLAHPNKSIFPYIYQ